MQPCLAAAAAANCCCAALLGTAAQNPGIRASDIPYAPPPLPKETLFLTPSPNCSPLRPSKSPSSSPLPPPTGLNLLHLSCAVAQSNGPRTDVSAHLPPSPRPPLARLRRYTRGGRGRPHQGGRCGSAQNQSISTPRDAAAPPVAAAGEPPIKVTRTCMFSRLAQKEHNPRADLAA